LLSASAGVYRLPVWHVRQSDDKASLRDRDAIEAARRALGRQLAALRQAAGYSQQEFAPLTGYGRSTLANVETGRQNVPRSFWVRCAQELADDGLVTGYDQIEAMTEAARADAQARAQAARDARVSAWRNGSHEGVVAAETADLPEGLEEKARLGYAFAHPANADLVAVAHLREQIRRLDERYDRSPAPALIAETGQCLGQIGFLSTHARRADVRRDLRGAEAEGAILMGQLVWDASQRRDHATALAYYEQAIAAARSRDDRAAEGLALLRTGMVALYGHKNPRTGLEICEHTADLTATASNVVAGLGVLHAAEAHAMLGDRRSCELALAAADRRFARISQDDPAIDLFSPAQPGRLAGSCYLFLGDPRQAAPILESTARQLQYRSKAEAITLGNLALAYIGQARVDEAAAALHKAIDVIQVTWGGGGLNIVFTAWRQLGRWQQVSEVREVQDRLLALMAAS
jgi:transcriptional regulator with XRE-family HTH domain